ncbi:MAG: sulfotransferase family protein [Luteimonas sp.]
MGEPRIRFLVGGVQKGGTTALARLLSQHPRIRLPDRMPDDAPVPDGDLGLAWKKEAHVFDAPWFDDAWSPQQVDARFAERFPGPAGDCLHGDATPVSVYHPRVVERVRRYNPGMRWIVLLRDPVERAISHYFMERAAGREPLSLFRAVLAEPARLRGDAFADMGRHAAWRRASYADRGRYARQLDWLLRHFPREQVLLLRAQDLAARPADTLASALAFLGLPPIEPESPDQRVLAGAYPPPPAWAPGRLLLRWRLRGESRRLRARHGIALGDA